MLPSSGTTCSCCRDGDSPVLPAPSGGMERQLTSCPHALREGTQQQNVILEQGARRHRTRCDDQTMTGSTDQHHDRQPGRTMAGPSRLLAN